MELTAARSAEFKVVWRFYGVRQYTSSAPEACDRVPPDGMDDLSLVVAEDAAVLKDVGDCDLSHETIAPAHQGEGFDLSPELGIGRCLVYR
jgi:hypothetical protein